MYRLLSLSKRKSLLQTCCTVQTISRAYPNQAFLLLIKFRNFELLNCYIRMTINRGLEFEFADCDSLLVELEEQYSYAETNDYQLNRQAAQALADEIDHEIGSELFCRRALANLEILNVETRLNSIRSILCVLQGGANVQPNETGLEDAEKRPTQEEQQILNAELIHGIRSGSYEIVKLEGWNILINLLLSESKSVKDEEDQEQLKYKQVSLRLLYSVCYTILEILRRPPGNFWSF